MFKFLLVNQLVTPIIQLITALTALAAVIWTQIALNRRAEKDIKSRFEQQKIQQEHEKQLKSQYLRLEKIEQIYEIVQNARQAYISLRNRIVEFEESALSDEQREYIKKILMECTIHRKQVELLSNIYLSNKEALCVFWEEKSKNIYPVFSRNKDSEPQKSSVVKGIDFTVHALNQILEKLSTYTSVSN